MLYQPSTNSNTAARASARVDSRVRSSSSHSRVAKKLIGDRIIQTIAHRAHRPRHAPASGGGGRQGSTVGEPRPAATGRRPAGENALPVADASREHDAAATPGVHAVAPELVAGGAGVGHQGVRDASVGLPLARLGGADVAPLVRVGDSQSPGADQEGRPDGEAALGGTGTG